MNFLACLSVCLLVTGTHGLVAKQQDDIPTYPLETVDLIGNTIYDFEGRTIFGTEIESGHVFSCLFQHNITVANLIVRGGPGHSLFFRGCSTITIDNVEIYDAGNIGMRFDNMGDVLQPGATPYVHKNVRVTDVFVNNSGGHGLEFWDLDGFYMDGLQADYTGNAGLLFNRNVNGHVGSMRGYRNCYGCEYATLRFANSAGPNITVGDVVSRESGRGFATTSHANGIEIDHIDIRGALIYGLRIVAGYNIYMHSGYVRGPDEMTNCQAIESWDNDISALDCGCGVNCWNPTTLPRKPTDTKLQ